MLMQKYQYFTTIYNISIFLYDPCYCCINSAHLFGICFCARKICIFMLGHFNLPFVLDLLNKDISFKDRSYIVHNNISITNIKSVMNNKLTLRCFNKITWVVLYTKMFDFHYNKMYNKLIKLIYNLIFMY